MILVCTATDCSCGNRKNGICSTDANTHMRKSHDICTESYICMYLDVRIPEVEGMSTDMGLMRVETLPVASTYGDPLDQL